MIVAIPQPRRRPLQVSLTSKGDYTSPREITGLGLFHSDVLLIYQNTPVTLTLPSSTVIDQKLNFLCSTNIFYGRGRFLDVPAYLAESGIKRILLVIDPYWWSKRSEVQDFLQEISRREISYSVTFDIEPDPSVACVERVRKSIDVDGLEKPDAIVALGGGSTIDVAKGLSALLRHEGALDDLIKGIPPTLSPIPLIACPTTSGTGSELTPGAIFRQGTRDVKVGLRRSS